MSMDTLTAPGRNGHATPPATDAGDAEQCVCGSMMLGGVDDERLRPDHFGDERCRRLYSTLVDMRAEGQDIDVVTIRRELLSRGWSPVDGWDCYLAATMQSVPHAYHLDSYATQVIDAWRRRRIIEAARSAMIAASDLSVEIDDVETRMREIDDDRQSHTAPVSLATLRQSHRDLRPPIIHGLMREGETVNLIAPPKVGKSWAAMDLAMSVATGRPWLDRYETVGGRVLYVDNELHPETLAHRIGSVAYARSLSADDVADRIDVMTLRGRLTDIHGLSMMLRRVESGAYAVVVLDALYRMLPAGASENDNAGMAAVYNALDAIADRMRCGIVLIHHASKGDQSSKSVTDVGSGAGSQSRAADAHLILRPHETEGCYVMDAVVRSWAPAEPLVLRWEFPVWMPAGELDPSNLRRPQTADDARQQQRDREGMDAIAMALADGSQTRRRLRERCGMGPDRVNRLVASMAESGDVTVTTDDDGTDLITLPEGGGL